MTFTTKKDGSSPIVREMGPSFFVLLLKGPGGQWFEQGEARTYKAAEKLRDEHYLNDENAVWRIKEEQMPDRVRKPKKKTDDDRRAAR